MCVKLLALIFRWYSVQLALGTQCGNSRICEIWMEVELEGGCFCNSVQVRKNRSSYTIRCQVQLYNCFEINHIMQMAVV